MTVCVYFADEAFSVEVASGQSLTDICDQYPTSLLFGCRDGACGTCLIEVVEGIDHLDAVTEVERDMLTVMAEGNQQARLACQCTVRGDIRIRSLK